LTRSERQKGGGSDLLDEADEPKKLSQGD